MNFVSQGDTVNNRPDELPGKIHLPIVKSGKWIFVVLRSKFLKPNLDDEIDSIGYTFTW
jgi:hypothetical protein